MLSETNSSIASVSWALKAATNLFRMSEEDCWEKAKEEKNIVEQQSIANRLMIIAFAVNLLPAATAVSLFEDHRVSSGNPFSCSLRRVHRNRYAISFHPIFGIRS